MTQDEAIAIESCPVCGFRVMKNHDTGLVSCLSRLEFKECKWHIRVRPWEIDTRKDTMTKKEKRLAEMQAEIDRRFKEWGE